MATSDAYIESSDVLVTPSNWHSLFDSSPRNLDPSRLSNFHETTRYQPILRGNATIWVRIHHPVFFLQLQVVNNLPKHGLLARRGTVRTTSRIRMLASADFRREFELYSSLNLRKATRALHSGQGRDQYILQTRIPDRRSQFSLLGNILHPTTSNDDIQGASTVHFRQDACFDIKPVSRYLFRWNYFSCLSSKSPSLPTPGTL